MSTEAEVPHFRSPEEVAPTLGMTKTELRRYAKESGHYTVLSKNRIMLDADNINGILGWIKTRSQENRKQDPFA